MLSVTTLVLAIICFILFVLLINRNTNYWSRKGIPFEKPLPFIGNMKDVLLLRKSMPFMVADLYFKFQNTPYFGMWLFTIPHLILRSPELIKQILVRDFDHFNDRNVTYNENVDAITANMLFFLRNPKWKIIRTNTTPMFSSSKLRYMYPQLQVVAKDMLSFISARTNSLINAKELTVRFSTDIICSTAFGIDSQSFQDDDTPFTNIGKTTFKINLANTLAAATYFCDSVLVDIFKIKFVQTSVASFMTEIFLNIVKERDSVKSDRKDLIDIMITLRQELGLKDHELVSQAVQFFIAGYETTSSTITFALYELSINKSIQNKLRDEINENVDENGDPSYTIVNEMEYLKKIIDETLRKYPPLPFLGRTCVKDYKIPNTDVVIEKGTSVMVPLMGLHHDPEYFPEPEKFDPERFSEENVKTRPPHSYLPFGDGQRNCIGRRSALLFAKLALTYIVRNFEFELHSDVKIPLKFDPRTFILHCAPILLKFRKLYSDEL